MTKNYVFAGALLLAATGAHAQGYAGALVMLSNINGGCVEGGPSCDQRGAASARIYGGVSLAKPRFGFHSVEVGFMRSGAARSVAPVSVRVEDEFGEPVVVFRDAHFDVRSTAITWAAVTSFPLTQKLDLAGRVGVAYVSTTVNLRGQDLDSLSATTRRFSPYFGVALEYAVSPAVKLIGGVDAYRWRIEGNGVDGTGSVAQFGLGAQASF